MMANLVLCLVFRYHSINFLQPTYTVNTFIRTWRIDVNKMSHYCSITCMVYMITFIFLVAVDKPEVDQTEQYPGEGSSHNLTCTFRLPDGVSPDHLQIDWVKNGSVMTNSSRISISDIMKARAQNYTKIATFQEVQSTDSGNYNCTVKILSFVNFNTITVNGKHCCVYVRI